jgi:hypothetical protein
VYPGDGQQHSSYQGLGYYQPQPPRKGRNLVMILSIVAIVVIIAVVVTIVLVNRGGSTPGAQNTPAPTTQATGTASTSAKADPLKPRNSGWSVIKNEKAKLIYEVPPSWTVVPNGSLPSKAMPDVVMSSPATIGSYQCENGKYTRGGLGAGSVPKTDVAKQATDIAKAFGADFYSTAGTPTVQTAEPTQVTHKDIDGKSVKGAQVDATITTAGGNCLAAKGKVSVLVLDAGADAQFFVVNGDVEGGPATPPPPREADLQKIVDSARGYSP